MSARRLLFAALATAATLAAPTAARAEYIVDNFNTPTQTFAITSAGTNPWTTPRSSSDWTGSATVTSTPTFTTGGVSGYLGADPDGIMGNGLGVFSGRATATATLQYSFTTPQDFSTIPGAGVVLRFADSDQNMPFTVTLGDGAGTATGTATTNGVPGVYYIPFTELTGTVDFSSIDTLQVVVNGNPGALSGTDFVLTEVKIAPVPAPAGVVLGLAALPGLGLWRLRRRTV